MNQAALDLSLSYNLPKSPLEVNEVGPLFLRSLFLKADIWLNKTPTLGTL